MKQLRPNLASVVSAAVVRATGTRFCSYHHGHSKVEAGRFVLRGRVQRWMCQACLIVRGLALNAPALPTDDIVAGGMQ